MTSYMEKGKAVKTGLITAAEEASPLIRNILCAVVELDTVILSKLYDAVEADVVLRQKAKADLQALLAETDWTEAKALAKAGRKIDAIILVRQTVPMGLKEAKDFVEAW